MKKEKTIDISKERMIGMEAYKHGLLLWLESEVSDCIKNGGNKMSDVYIGKMNVYEEIIKHVKGNLRKK